MTHITGAAGSGKSQCLAAQGAPEDSKPLHSLQESAAEVARVMTREQVYAAAERASHFLTCLMAHVAADDQPGIAYNYRKFAAFGNVVRESVKELISGGRGGPP